MLIEVRVTPGAKRDEVIELKPGFYKIKTTADAKEGEANRAVLDLIADHLRLPRSLVRLHRGGRSRTKLVEIPE